MAFIRKVPTASGATAVQIAYKAHGRITRIEHIGSAHTPFDLELLVTLAKQRLLGPQQSLFAHLDDAVAAPLKIRLKQSASALLLELLRQQYDRLGFDQLGDDVFAHLCVARIVEPTSKLDSLRVLAELGVSGYSKNRLYRCLQRVVAHDYRGRLATCCLAAAAGPLSVVLYDVTTLYFEVQEEDGYRKPGLSKERRLEPQIVVGLLVDQTGFPLGLHSFAGNTAETNTLLPILEAFKREHGLTDITVVADAGMLSAKNLQALADAGYRYIVGSRLYKIPYAIAEYQQTNQVLTDHQIIRDELGRGQRVIYQYREKRAALDLRNIAKQVAKAERIVNGTMGVRKVKFLTATTNSQQLNQTLIAKAKALAGIKGYVTNSDQSDAEVIAAYHQLWHVEASFRMSKSDLRARPIFHRVRDAIEAHLTVVFAALAVSKAIERRTGISIRRFVKTVRLIRAGVITMNGKDYLVEAEVPKEVKLLIEKLRVGH